MPHRCGYALLIPLFIAAAASFGGCSTSPQPDQQTASDPDTVNKQADAAEGDGDPAAQAQAYADRLAAAMGQSDGDGAGGADATAPDIRWLEPGAPTPLLDQPTEPTPVPPNPASQGAPQPAPVESESDSGPVEPSRTASPPSRTESRGELMERLLARIRQSEDPELTKAMAAATLAMLDPTRDMDRRLLEPLSFEQRAIVERYHQVLSVLMDEVAAGETRLNRAAIDARLDELFGQQPIDIRTIELCRRVTGYGIYEPFEKSVFLAGTSHKMIVYVELDHFQTHKHDEDKYEVKLEQELTLYNESDGLAVWRNDPVQIVDTSRNRRNDFFVVQLINLPPRLSVGKYRLKVRVTDRHGGSLDEKTIPLQIVADEAMVQN